MFNGGTNNNTPHHPDLLISLKRFIAMIVCQPVMPKIIIVYVIQKMSGEDFPRPAPFMIKSVITP
jgi:hypothetical protein